MLSSVDTISPDDERRHYPGPGSLPLWSESYWFPIYDPETGIGVVTRIGILPNQSLANLWLFISQDGKIVHNASNLVCAVPDGDIDNLRLKKVTYRCVEPLRKWRLTYDAGGYGMDLLWQAFCPVYQYPVSPDSTADQAARHIEQSGRVHGTVRIDGKTYKLNCLAHRDHSWGGERDWAKFGTWTYVSCEFGEDLSFNAVKISFDAQTHLKLGFFWDGEHVMGLQDHDVALRTNPAATVQTGASIWLVNEKGVRHEIEAEVLDVCPVTIGATQVNDAICRFRSDDRVGYGIIEYGYQLSGVSK